MVGVASEQELDAGRKHGEETRLILKTVYR